MQSTVGQILVNETLPPDLRDHSRVLDKKGINTLLQSVAQRYPEKYREISFALNQIGWRSAQQSGGYSFGLQHIRKSRYSQQLDTKLHAQIEAIKDDDTLSDKQREEAIIKLVGGYSKEQQDNVFDESLAEKNPLAMQVLSGARGNRMNLASLRGSDMLYADHRDQVIPIPVLRSYSEGLTPAEYWAGSYGARKGVIDLKMATAEAGYFGKQLNQITHRLVVTDLDSDDQDETRGLPTDTDDADNEGALLARGVGAYKRNTVLTPKVLKHLAQLGHKRILVRSPMTGGSRAGGVYARDVGVRERGTLPGRGELPGMAAAQALAEPITQSMMSSKHTGGVASEGKAISGFDYIDQLVQVPKRFRGGASHADVDGLVSKIVPAPAGGNYVYIDGKQHYVEADVKLKVKPGDHVEAGDTISEGMPSPAKIVEHKGIGEGRQYFVKAFRTALSDAGIRVHRRNVELLARGLINHVQLDTELGDYAPDDTVPYSLVEQHYKPRADARTVEPSLAANKYLERPVLHYSIGTKIRPSVQRELKTFGIDKIDVHDKPAPFTATMIRGMASLSNDQDWMTRMYGSGLKRSLLSGAQRGATSTDQGSSFVAGLSRGVDFGRTGLVHQPEPGYKVDLGEASLGPVKTAASPVVAPVPSPAPVKPAAPPVKPAAPPVKPAAPPATFHPKAVAARYAKPPIDQDGVRGFGIQSQPSADSADNSLFSTASALRPYLGAAGSALQTVALLPKTLSTLMRGPGSVGDPDIAGPQPDYRPVARDPGIAGPQSNYRPVASDPGIAGPQSKGPTVPQSLGRIAANLPSAAPTAAAPAVATPPTAPADTSVGAMGHDWTTPQDSLLGGASNVGPSMLKMRKALLPLKVTKLNPVSLLAFDAAATVGGGYMAGRQLGYGHLAATPMGMKARNDTVMKRQQEHGFAADKGVGGNLGEAWHANMDALNNPIDSAVATVRNQAAVANAPFEGAVAGYQERGRQQRMTEGYNANDAGEKYQRVQVPDANAGWGTKIMNGFTSPMVTRYRGPDGALHTYEELEQANPNFRKTSAVLGSLAGRS